ncbi:pleiotropic drug resistance protein 2-like isoform X3 [Iris pallida]|uniref:Pleiotropic drug resistance protein 2-like isoform X3 n=1 Tax=Iris pallida TaxID=29817 RepID=A0AAX6FFV3_IRIPA|nr:pleiotropic drug resistance protein 2-like isoform X3 [Iris pallida]
MVPSPSPLSSFMCIHQRLCCPPPLPTKSRRLPPPHLQPLRSSEDKTVHPMTNKIHPWWLWEYWASSMQYGQTAIAVNEFLDPR